MHVADGRGHWGVADESRALNAVESFTGMKERRRGQHDTQREEPE